jgi:hypothetical protein
MKRHPSSWAVFIGCLLLLGLGATRYGKAADLTLISVRLTFVVLLSILAVRETWNHFHQENRDQPAVHDTLLQRCRRWYRGEA